MHVFKFAAVVKGDQGWQVVKSDLVGAENLEQAKIKAYRAVPQEVVNDPTLEVLVAPFV